MADKGERMFTANWSKLKKLCPLCGGRKLTPYDVYRPICIVCGKKRKKA